jgi:hypothetical protein
MPYRSGRFGNVFYVAWQSAPLTEELSAIEAEVALAVKATGHKLLYLTIVPATAPVPSTEQRKALDAFALRMRELVEHAFLVLEGEGFRASIQRSVIIGLTMWKERGYTTICRNVENALTRMAEHGEESRNALVAGAREQGLVR